MGVDLADTRLLSKKNKGIKYLLSNRKPNKIWVDQGGEFYNHVFKR